MALARRVVVIGIVVVMGVGVFFAYEYFQLAPVGSAQPTKTEVSTTTSAQTEQAQAQQIQQSRADLFAASAVVDHGSSSANLAVEGEFLTDPNHQYEYCSIQPIGTATDRVFNAARQGELS